MVRREKSWNVFCRSTRMDFLMDCIGDVSSKGAEDEAGLLAIVTGRMEFTCTEMGKTVGVASCSGEDSF